MPEQFTDCDIGLSGSYASIQWRLHGHVTIRVRK